MLAPFVPFSDRRPGAVQSRCDFTGSARLDLDLEAEVGAAEARLSPLLGERAQLVEGGAPGADLLDREVALVAQIHLLRIAFEEIEHAVRLDQRPPARVTSDPELQRE